MEIIKHIALCLLTGTALGFIAGFIEYVRKIRKAG
jgi:hypothetical protein